MAKSHHINYIYCSRGNGCEAYKQWAKSGKYQSQFVISKFKDGEYCCKALNTRVGRPSSCEVLKTLNLLEKIAEGAKK